MTNNGFYKIKKIKDHTIAKNKNLEAVYLTKENAAKYADETKAFSIFNETTLLCGFMHFQKLPVWFICINPKSSKTRKYIFESEDIFNKYFQLEG